MSVRTNRKSRSISAKVNFNQSFKDHGFLKSITTCYQIFPSERQPVHWKSLEESFAFSNFDLPWRELRCSRSPACILDVDKVRRCAAKTMSKRPAREHKSPFRPAYAYAPVFGGSNFRTPPSSNGDAAMQLPCRFSAPHHSTPMYSTFRCT